MKNDFSIPKGHLVDLTHNYSTETIYWPTEEGFKLDKEFDGMTEKGYYNSKINDLVKLKVRILIDPH